LYQPLYIPLSSTSACHFLWVDSQFHLLLYKLGPLETLASLYPCISPLSDQLRVAVNKRCILGDTYVCVALHIYVARSISISVLTKCVISYIVPSTTFSLSKETFRGLNLRARSSLSIVNRAMGESCRQEEREEVQL
jgi:hypothetical protein